MRIGIALLLSGCLLVLMARDVTAQQHVDGEISAGGLLGAEAGGYVDAMKALPYAPFMGMVGEFQAFRPEVLLLGGVRLRFVPRGWQGDVFVQLQLGVSSYDRSCAGCSGPVVQAGIGFDVPFNERWAVRARADVRGGGGAGDLPFGTIGGGVVRYWGKR